MKSQILIMSIGKADKERIRQASRHSKSMTDFVIKGLFKFMKYRTLIEQAEKLNLKTKAMKVVIK